MLRAPRAARTKRVHDDLVCEVLGVIYASSHWKLKKEGILHCFICSLFSPSLSLISYLCFFPGRWHLVPAIHCTLVASLFEPSSIRSKHGRSCERQHHVLITRCWALRYRKLLAKPQQINTPLKELSTQEETMFFDVSVVSPDGLGYRCSFVGPSNIALFTFGSWGFSRTSHVHCSSAELSLIYLPAAVYLFLSVAS